MADETRVAESFAEPPAPESPARPRWKKIFWIASVIFAIVLLTSALAAILTYRVYRQDLPSLSRLTNIEPSLPTRVISIDGQLLKEFYIERRTLVPFIQMPSYLVEALIATEDRRFYDHWGVNPLGILRALLVNLTRGEVVQGGSTITQQLARTLFLTREKTLSRKLKELLTAIKIERAYSKQEILEIYLNQCYFGKGAYGIQAAATTFFGKNARELTLPECALLVGLLKAPNRYSPVERPLGALLRRNTVLQNLVEIKKLSPKVADSLKLLPLGLRLHIDVLGEAPYFTELVRQYLEEHYGEKMLFSGGLTVFTTLNSELQKKAEIALNTGLDSLQADMERSHSLRDPRYTEEVIDTLDGRIKKKRVYKKLQAAFLAIDNATGNLVALIGGRNFAQSKFNRAYQSLRQPGSAFKPFVYTAAIDNGFRPSDIFFDTPLVLNIPGFGEWRPQNIDNEFHGPMTLRTGLQFSRNLIAIKLLQKVQPQQAIYYAQKMGITSELKPVPSLAIGTSEVSLWDMVSAYSVFPNGGIRVEPKFILKIVDRNGNVLEKHPTSRRKEVLSPTTAYIMTNLMQTVVDHGTARRARAMGFDRPAAGKTGTTDNFSDNWFLGFTPQFTAGSWVGFDDKTSIGQNQTGATNALPIWTLFMSAAHKNLPVKDFDVPSGIIFADVCAETGELATDKCPTVLYNEVFTEQTLPPQYCSKHPSKDPAYRQSPKDISTD